MITTTTDPTEAEIQKVAYRLYLESGCEHGHDLEHWFAARELLLHHHGRPPAARSRRQPLPRSQAAGSSSITLNR
jgi:hypothetical protein